MTLEISNANIIISLIQTTMEPWNHSFGIPEMAVEI